MSDLSFSRVANVDSRSWTVVPERGPVSHSSPDGLEAAKEERASAGARGRCGSQSRAPSRRSGWKIFVAAILLSFSSLGLPAADPAPASVQSDEVETSNLLQHIDTGSYALPDLPLKTNLNFAHSSSDVEPYAGVKPFKEHFLLQMEYTGPGRGIPEPDHVDSVKIGFLGPIMPTVSVATGGKSHNEETLGISMLRACRMAVEEANEKGGYLRRKIPFELCVHNDNALWGASGSEVIDLAYKDKVWAIIGGIDGANTHIAIRVALKIEIPWMTPGDLDPTYIETNIPWVMRCIGDDRQLNYILVDYALRKRGFKRPAIIRSSNRYGRFGVREIRDSCRRLEHPVVIEMAYKVGATNFDLQLDRMQEYNPDVIFHWGNGDDAARVLNAIRGRGWSQPFLTCDRAVSDSFMNVAGTNAEGVVCGYPWNPTRNDPKLTRFRAEFRKRYGTDPDTYAAHAYDGANMLIWAIQNAGLNRAKIRDMLAFRTTPWPGVTGDIPLSSALDDAGEVFLTRFENGKWVYYSRENLGIPRGNIIEEMRRDRDQAKAQR